MAEVEDFDLESIWNETDDDGNLVNPPDPELSDDDNVDDAGATDEETTQDEEEAVDETPAEGTEEVDYKSMYLAEKHRAESALGRLKAQNPPAQQQQAPIEETPAEPSEDDKFLAKFRDEYKDDVLRAVEIVAARRTEAALNQFAQSRLLPVERSAQDLVAQAHTNAITAVHPDVYDIDESAEFQAWIDTKPVHVRGAYEYVREQGTPAEVISLLNEYKSSTGRVQKTNTPSQTRVNAAAAVPRRRGAPQSAVQQVEELDEKALWDSIPD